MIVVNVFSDGFTINFPWFNKLYKFKKYNVIHYTTLKTMFTTDVFVEIKNNICNMFLQQKLDTIQLNCHYNQLCHKNINYE